MQTVAADTVRREPGIEGETTIPADAAAEILRLRDKYHDLEKETWAALELGKENARGLAALRDELRTVGRELHELDEKVDGMSEAEKTAGLVTAAIRADRRARWTVPRVLAGAVLSAVLAVPAAHELVAWITG